MLHLGKKTKEMTTEQKVNDLVSLIVFFLQYMLIIIIMMMMMLLFSHTPF